MENSEKYSISEYVAPQGRKKAPLRFIQKLFPDISEKHYREFDPFAEQQGQWHDADKQKTCEMLEGFGYEIINEDVGSIPRDVIVHFRKP